MTGKEWEALGAFAKERAPAPISTSLLGPVPYTVVDGRAKGYVPERVAIPAAKYGLVPLAPDPLKNEYWFRMADFLTQR